MNSGLVSLVKTQNRREGIKRAVSLLDENPLKGKEVLIKPNLNTSDPFPGSSHPETIEALIELVWEMGAKTVSLGDRSGPEDTTEVIKNLGIDRICRNHDVKLINFDDLPETEWVKITPEGSHWRDGFLIARPVLEAEAVVSTCCLKTHRYGAVFTISLKNSVGTVHRRNMSELHSNMRDMRRMIAEINTAWSPALVVVDALEVFADGGPMTGLRKQADLIFAGFDRVAVDALGLAILKSLGSNGAVMNTPIFKQEQIERAVEMGIGIRNPDDIKVITTDDAKSLGDQLMDIIKSGR